MPHRLLPPTLLLAAMVSAPPAVGQASDAGGAPEASRWRVRAWQRTEGLPQNSVYCLAEGRDGYLWAGTAGGLARFDGVRFTAFGLKQGLGALGVVALEPDGDWGLWIGTFGGGLSRLRGGELATWGTGDGLAHPYVTELAKAEGGGVWVGGPAGLQHFDGEAFRTVGAAEGLPPGEVTGLAAKRGGGLWIANGNAGLFEWDGRQCAPVSGPEGGEVVRAYTILGAASGDLWASIGYGRLLRLCDGVWREYNSGDGLPASFVYCLGEGAPGEIWAGSGEAGLYVLRSGRFARVAPGELGPAVRSLAGARDGSMWVGTETRGLHRVAEAPLDYYPVREGGRVGGLVGTGEGEFWVATYGGGVLRGRLGALDQAAGHPEFASHTAMLCALRRRSGALMFAGAQRVFEVGAGGAPVRSHAVRGTVTALFEDAGGAVWLGYRDGRLARWGEGRPDDPEGEPLGGGITSFADAGDGALWVGTTGDGLHRWAGGRAEKVAGLPVANVSTLYRDAGGTLWVGTVGGGLAWIEGGEVRAVDRSHGLADEVVHQILEDGSGHLWLGGHRGISRVAKSELRAVAAGGAGHVHPLVLDESDGLRVAECTGGYSPSGFRSESGRLYFATARGVAEIDPRRPWRGRPPPPVRIEGATVAGRELAPSAAGIVLAPSPRDLEVRFTAFDFNKPEQLRFRHRLVGSGGGWSAAGDARGVRYASLAPGQYRFEVSAAGSDGVWSEPAASLAIRVPPEWWQRAWFKGATLVALALLGAGAVALVARRRIRAAGAELRAQQRRAEVDHLTRLATLGELSAALSHELNQPLAAILSNAQAARRFLARGGAEPGEIEAILDDIVADDRRASEVIGRLRGLLKRGEFHPEKVACAELVEAVLDLMGGDLAARGVRVSAGVAPGLPPMRADRIQMQQVLINLITNACEAMGSAGAGAEAVLEISAAPAGEGVQISVRDSGPGLPDGDAERLFEPYHSTKADGLGLGLSLSRSIVFAHGGELWAEAGAGGGAVFHVKIPTWQEGPTAP